MNDHATSLIRSYFTGSDHGQLCLGSIPVQDLAEKYGTPFYAYDASIIDRKLSALRTALPQGFSVSYSVKANPAKPILRHFLSRGCGLEVASAGEFSHAVAAGCPAQNIVFAGPGKGEAELALAIANGIGEIHIESLIEAKRISAICERLDIRQRVAIRVNPISDAEGGAMRMGGRPTPFGIDEETLDSVLGLVLRERGLDFCGIHLFTGTQILEAETLARQYQHGLAMGRRIVHRTGARMRVMDFGGGLGVPYFAHERELDLEAVQSKLADLFDRVASDPAFSGTRFLVEPGRFLVAEAGIYVARINDVKVSRGKTFLILDGGMNHHLAASGNLGQTIKRNYPMAIANRLTSSDYEIVDIVGPLCTPLDTLARGISLAKASIGDLVVIFQSGAYGRSASPLHFLSHALPTEIWVSSGKDAKIESQEESAPIIAASLPVNVH